MLNVDIRSRYQFQAELNGELKLEINGAVVLNATGNGETMPPSQSVRLGKGTNEFAVSFRNPSDGDAWFRLHWIPRNGLPRPIPASSLSYAPDAPLEAANRIRLGRSLFIEHRCAKCHALETSEHTIPELAIDAPSFEGIGSRRNFNWTADWILDPKAHRASARMPRTLHGPDSGKDAFNIASFLITLKAESSEITSAQHTPEQVESGRKLFSALHCAACHTETGTVDSSENALPLDFVNNKFPGARLVEFLLQPNAHFAWIRMPNFHLTVDEATNLAAFLGSEVGLPEAPRSPGNTEAIRAGRQLVQTRGCLNCHSLSLENHFSTTGFKDMAPDVFDSGCLATDPAENSKAPAFGFTTVEKEAIRAFAISGLDSLNRHVPLDFADRHIRNLGCTKCHGNVDGFPSLDNLGAKLRPEWSAQFIAGGIPFKPRSWIPARMPAFSAYAKDLSKGMAALHGFPPQTAAEKTIDKDAAEIGRKLVASDGGFSCISCHSIGKIGATAVFESPGINFVYSADRLLKPYFARWIFNPLDLDPTSKMPVYFDEQGMSPLIDIYDGNGAQQIDAIWEYLRLRDEMQPPPGLVPAN